MLRALCQWGRSVVALATLLVVVTTGTAGAFQTGELAGPLQSVAPENCWLYSSWSNQSRPDANSTNRTDQLLAEPEVREFVDDLMKRAEMILPLAFSNAPEAKRKLAAELSPVLWDSIFRKSGCLFVENVVIRGPEMPPEVEAVLLLEVGDRAEALASALAQLATAENDQPGSLQIAGQPFYVIPFDESAAASLLLGSSGGYLVAGMGEDAVGRALQRMSGNATPAWLEDLQSRHSLARRSSLGYVNLHAVRDALLPLGGNEAAQIVSALGLANVESLESSSGYSETEMVNRMLLGIKGQPQGLLALFGDEGIEASELQHVPADALFAVAMSVDAAKVMDFVQKLMLQFNPREAMDMAQGLQQFQAETGVDLRNDLLDQIGPTWTIYNGASDGWMTGIAMTATVKDAQRLKHAVDELLQTIRDLSDGDPYAPRFVSRTVGDAEIVTLRIPEMPLPFEPSWCIAGDRILVTLFPQTIIPVVRPMEYDTLIDASAFESMRQPFSSRDGNSKLLGYSWQNSQRQLEILYPYIQIFMGMSRMMMAEMGEMPDEVVDWMEPLTGGINLPPARSIHKHLIPAVSFFRQTTTGFEVETRQTVPMVDVTLTVPVAVALLLPAVQQVRVAARRAQSQNNLKMMALAVHNYESAFKKLPAGFGNLRAENPPVSWRVMILPYVEEQGLYDLYRFDEPWDSEHNLELARQMPEVFRSPNSQAGPGMTVYRGIGGVGGAFGTDANGTSSPRKFAHFRDGLSNTILFVETGDELAVPWTQPDEGIDPESFDLFSLFGQYPGGFNAAMGDGSVRFFPNTILSEELKLFMEMADGQVVPDLYDR